ncbi:MAG: hypothetical protein ACT4P7_11610 [Gemmatimonadaceae bacterium]
MSTAQAPYISSAIDETGALVGTRAGEVAHGRSHSPGTSAECGADASVVSEHGATAAQLAAKRGLDGVAAVLRAALSNSI